MRLQKKQEKQAKNLQAAKRQHKKDKADLRDTIRLTPDAKLTSRQKRRLSASVQKAKRDGKIPRTAQQTIPYQEMCRDGICVVSERFFTKQVQFYDINYQLAQNEDKNLIFENWCDFLNCATRSRTNTILQGVKLCGRKDHMVVKAGGLQRQTKATTYTLKSGMMG